MRKPQGMAALPGFCRSCGTKLDRPPRENARSLFGCPDCGRVVEGMEPLPPAVKHHKGKSLSTDRTKKGGAVLFIEGETVTLTFWETPFLEGAPVVLSKAEFRRRFGI